MTQVSRALAYLWYHSLRNQVRTQVGRIRQPRYLLAIVFGLGYLWLIFGMYRDPEDAPFHALATTDAGPVLASALLLAAAARWWLAGRDRGALAFTPAEVSLLFPAPIARRQLVHAKLMRGQMAIFINVLLWVFLLRGDTGGGWQRGVGLWILFSTLALHRLGAAMVRLNATEHRGAGIRRAALPTALFASMLGVVIWAVWRSGDAIRAADGFSDRISAAYDGLQHPLAAAVLLPVRALVTPVFAQSSSEWWLAIGPALLMVALHYMWVVRSDAAFEEAALEASQHMAERLQRAKAGQMVDTRSKRGKVAWIPRLPMFGPPAMALIWKNIAAGMRTGWRFQMLLFAALAVAMIGVAYIATDGDGDWYSIAVGMVIGIVFMLLLLGPVWTRYDLRLDLRQFALLKSLPLRGRDIVSAEIAAVTILHTLSIWAFLAVPLAILLLRPSGEFPVSIPVMTAGLLLVPVFNLLAFTGHNAMALLFPAWVQLGTDSRGFEAMGQTMLTMGATFIGMAVALVFPVAISVAVGYIAVSWLGSWGLLLAALTLTLVVLAELYPLQLWLGDVFDQTDLRDIPGQL